jgi:hypothetical protein
MDPSIKKLLRRLKSHLVDVDGHHTEMLETNDAARDGEITSKDALASTRRSLVASRGCLDSAHALILQLLRGRADDDADTNEELSMAAIVRKTRLDNLDRIRVGARARPPTAVQLGGGAHTVNHCREQEIARLRALW